MFAKVFKSIRFQSHSWACLYCKPDFFNRVGEEKDIFSAPIKLILCLVFNSHIFCLFMHFGTTKLTFDSPIFSFCKNNSGRKMEYTFTSLFTCKLKVKRQP